MRGSLTLANIETECILGILPEERTQPQKIRLDVEVQVDFLESVGATTAAQTVDWSVLPKKLVQVLVDGKFHLAETACCELLKNVFLFPKAHSAKVTITKLEAVTGATSVSATLEATAEEFAKWVTTQKHHP